jgi:hypothetical protein
VQLPVVGVSLGGPYHHELLYTGVSVDIMSTKPCTRAYRVTPLKLIQKSGSL